MDNELFLDRRSYEPKTINILLPTSWFFIGNFPCPAWKLVKG